MTMASSSNTPLASPSREFSHLQRRNTQKVAEKKIPIGGHVCVCAKAVRRPSQQLDGLFCAEGDHSEPAGLYAALGVCAIAPDCAEVPSAGPAPLTPAAAIACARGLYRRRDAAKPSTDSVWYLFPKLLHYGKPDVQAFLMCLVVFVQYHIW